MMKKKAFVQFSKRIVVLVTIAVTVACYGSIILCWDQGDIPSLVEVIDSFIRYATLVFIAYSGNSALEKWLVNSKAETASKSDADEDTSSGVG